MGNLMSFAMSTGAHALKDVLLFIGLVITVVVVSLTVRRSSRNREVSKLKPPRRPSPLHGSSAVIDPVRAPCGLCGSTTHSRCYPENGYAQALWDRNQEIRRYKDYGMGR